MTDVMVEMRAANPAPAESEPHPTAWSDTALLAEIDTRSGPDMNLDQKRRTERAAATDGPRRWSRGLAAAAAFVLVIGAVGIAALVLDGDGSPDPIDPVATTSPPTTEPPQPSTTLPVSDPDALSPSDSMFVEQFVDTWNNDIDSYLALFDQNAVIQTLFSAKYDIMVDSPTVIPNDRYEAMARWEAAIGTETNLEVDRCTNRAGSIVCPFSQTDPLIAGTIAIVSGHLELDLSEEGQIRGLGFSWASDFGYGGIVNELEAWMESNYPEEAASVGMSGIYTPDSAERWNQFVPRYLGLDAPLTEEEAAFATSFFDSWGTDVDAYLALFDPEAEIGTTNASKYGPWVNPPGSFQRIEWSDFVALSEWEFWVGTESTTDVSRCVARDNQVVCPFELSDPLIGVTLLRLQGVATFELNSGQITRLELHWAVSGNGPGSEFQGWLGQNHPDVANRMFVGSVEPALSQESANLWKIYAELYSEALRG